MTRERVVIDTNVLISSLLLATSTPARAVDKAVANAQLVATMDTLREEEMKKEGRLQQAETITTFFRLEQGGLT